MWIDIKRTDFQYFQKGGGLPSLTLKLYSIPQWPLQRARISVADAGYKPGTTRPQQSGGYFELPHLHKLIFIDSKYCNKSGE